MTPSDDALQLSKCLCPDWLSDAYEQARKVSNPQPSVLEAVAPPLARAQGIARMTECAAGREVLLLAPER